MEFTTKQATELLKRTPIVLTHLLGNLSDEWVMNNEGNDTWSPFDVMGHLAHGEKTDWMERVAIILSDKEEKKFKPFDRFAQKETSKGKTINDLLEEFATSRASNLKRLEDFNINDDDLKKTGVHPAFGEVQLSQLLATWVVHDLNHLAQIERTMASQYKEAVGPWIEYFRILK